MRHIIVSLDATAVRSVANRKTNDDDDGAELPSLGHESIKLPSHV
jgi:hypothetical protein